MNDMSVLFEGAVVMHELYMTYMQAGFTSDQAMYLVGITLQASILATPPKLGE